MFFIARCDVFVDSPGFRSGVVILTYLHKKVPIYYIYGILRRRN